MALRLIAHLHKATHQVGLYVHRELGELAISQAEAHVLSYLSARGPCSIADVHHSFGHRRSTLTSILNRLEDRGLITREIHPDDRRSVLLRLTRDGKPVAVQRPKDPGATRSRGSLLPERAAGLRLRCRDRGHPIGGRGRRERVDAPPGGLRWRSAEPRADGSPWSRSTPPRCSRAGRAGSVPVPRCRRRDLDRT